jgi:diguanylate cyclase (GGDEF)-like protein
MPAEAIDYAAAIPPPGLSAASGPCRADSLTGSLERKARDRMLSAILVAALFSLLACASFYLFELERAKRQQIAALAHFLGQTVIASEARWRQQLALHESSADNNAIWHFDAPTARLYRQFAPSKPGAPPLRQALDTLWLADWNRPDIRLFLVAHGQVLATSLGDAGAGEAAALDPLQSGPIYRGGQVFVQVPMRWDNHPDSPLLVAQQRLALLFSLPEVAAAGLLLWAILAGVVWLTVGIWLQEALRQVQFLAYHDPLTGLINRAALLVGLTHMLAESRRSRLHLAVLYLDLDRFKTINDSLGHSTGDRVLVEVAHRLGECVRETDFVARLGGDEFVLVLGELPDAQAVVPVARKLISRLSEPLQIGERTLHTSTSIGIALFPGDTDQREFLLKQADSAMYAAKRAGRGCFHFYDCSLGARADTRLQIEEKMRLALQQGDFVLHYQPIVEAGTPPHVLGFEALLRWPTADGPVSPETFIPLAEETGLIEPLGTWVLSEACRQMVNWRRHSPQRFAGLRMSVNLSLKQLLSGDFPKLVANALVASGLDAGSLELEITESLCNERYGRVPELLGALRQLGVRLALDDFGTGYSAFANLTRLPIDRLKIDRSFVRSIAVDENEYAVARTIVAIGRQLNLEVVAEGVETADQCRLLQAAGCRAMQGWLFGRAEAAARIPGWFDEFLTGGEEATIPP